MRKRCLKPSFDNQGSRLFSGGVDHFGSRASWSSILWGVTSWKVQTEHICTYRTLESTRLSWSGASRAILKTLESSASFCLVRFRCASGLVLARRGCSSFIANFQEIEKDAKTDKNILTGECNGRSVSYQSVTQQTDLCRGPGSSHRLAYELAPAWRTSRREKDNR